MIVLHTARLSSRPVGIADAPAIFATYGSDPLVARYMAWPVNRDVSDVEHFLAAIAPLTAQGSRQVLALAERSDPDWLIGTFEARFEAHRMDVGYVLGRTHWGRGLMTEALSAAVAWARATPCIRRVWAVCDADNRASARVMEKAGLNFEGVLRRWAVHPNIGDAPRDCTCYAATW